MIKTITDYIFKISKLRLFLFLAAAFIIIEILFSINVAVLTDKTEGSGLLDMSVAYSVDFAYEHLMSYQKAAAAYFRIRLADFVFPAVYAFMLATLSVFVYKRKYDSLDNYRWVLMVPFTAAVFDYTENVMLVVLFRLLPSRFDAAISVLKVITILKFGFIALSILLITTGALALLKGGDSGLLMGNKFKGKK